jgi:pre-rRNA-processing protein IPI1
LTQQSISAHAPTVAAQCAHHLSLLNHKSDSQRRDSLAYLTTAIASNPPGSPLPQPPSVILPAVQRLILDGSNAVRQQLLKLFKSLPAAEISSHSEQLLLHTRAGMTHLANEIRVFALDVLEWLLGVAGDDVVSCAGGWVKMLKCFLSLLGWQNDVTGNWSVTKSIGKSGGDAKVQVKQMTALVSFLRAGLVPAQGVPPTSAGGASFPLWQTTHHTLPERSYAFAHLNLFGAARDEEAEMYEDREDRQRVFHYRAEAAIIAGIEQSIKGGGELGRAAAQLRKVLREGMADFHGEETANS